MFLITNESSSLYSTVVVEEGIIDEKKSHPHAQEEVSDSTETEQHTT